MFYLFLDDIRNPDYPDLPDWYQDHAWTVVRSVEDAIELLNTLTSLKHVVISLDNDLGEGLREGYEVANYLEERAASGGGAPKAMFVHSSNPARRSSMLATFQSILRFEREA